MNTKKLKQLVLDLAIHGKLVPQDPNDEPASELLKRIVETHGRASNIGRASNKKSAISSDKIDEVPFDVPKGWVWTTIENAYVINPKNDSADDTIAGFVPMANVGDAFSNKFIYEERPWKVIKKGFSHFQNGDVAVAKISPCMENRKSVVFDNLPNGIGAGTTELNVFRSLIYPLYSLYFFKSEYFISRCTSTFLGTVGQQRVDKEVLLSIFIPLPPLSEQRRIVSEVEKWFGIIDQLESNEADLRKSIEQTKKKVLDLAIHGKLVPQDPNDEPASELLKRIVETHGRASNKSKGKKSAISSEENDEVPFEVPEGWVWCRLGEVMSVKSGDSLKVRNAEKGEFPIYGGNGINGYHDSFNVEEQTLIIGRVGFYCGSIHKTISKSWVTDNALIVSYENVFFVDFLYRLLIWLDLGTTSNSTAQPVVSGKGILPLLFPLPPLSEQRRIVAKIEEVFGELDRIEEMIG